MALQQSTCLESPSEGLKVTGSGVTQKYPALEGKQLSCDFDTDLVLGHLPSRVSYFSFSISRQERGGVNCHVTAVAIFPVALVDFDCTLNTSRAAWMLNFISFLEFSIE